MSGQPEVGELGAVVELDQRVDDRLRVDDDVDPPVVDGEQVVGLDQLQALVHQGRRVDRDPPAHVPGRMRERLRRAHALESSVRPRNGPPGGGEDQAIDRPRALGPQELEDRRVLGVDRQDPRLRRLGERGDELAADDEALLVGERQVDPLAEGDDRRPEPGDADDRVQDQVGLGRRDQVADALGAREDAGVAELGRRPAGGLGLRERDGDGARLARLRREPLPVGGRREPGDLELARARDDVERLLADRAGRAEDEDPLRDRVSVATGLRRR